MQEIRWGTVQAVDPVAVRFAGDDADTPIAMKAASYTPTFGDKVLLAKAGTIGGWVIVDKLDTQDAWPDVTVTGKASGTTDGSGQFTITFPREFVSAPVVTLEAQTTTNRAATLSTASATTASCVYRDRSTGAVVASAGYFVHWTATGQLLPET